MIIANFFDYNFRFLSSLGHGCEQIIDRLPDHYLGWSLVEHSFVLIGEAAKSLKYKTLAETSHAVSLLGGSCAAADIFWDFLRDVKKIASFSFRWKSMDFRALAVSAVAHDAATKVEELAYVTMLLNRTMFIKMASPLLAKCNAVASGAALAYNLIDLKKHGQEFLNFDGDDDERMLSWIKAEKTALHIIVDILGVLPIFLGTAVSLPIATSAILASYCIMTLWTNVVDVEEAKRSHVFR